MECKYHKIDMNVLLDKPNSLLEIAEARMYLGNKG